MIKVIVSKSYTDLSVLERFLLSCAAWTHDIGMNSEVAESYFKEMKDPKNVSENIKFRRREHHNISCWFLQKKCKIFFPNIEIDNTMSAFRAISIIIQYHRKSEDIDNCLEEVSIRGEIVRIKMLAAILRLADTLHKDISRFDPSLYAMLQIASFDRISRLHWLKSFVVSNIHLNENNQTITIQLHLPDYTQYEEYNREEQCSSFWDVKKRDWVERLRNLKYIISTDIEEDLVVVNKIFSNYGLPTYVNVRIEESFIRGFSKKYYTEINGVLSELDILFSPNTSKVIKRTLDSIEILSKTETIEPIFDSQLNQLKGYIEEIYEERPCHVGLGKIINIIDHLPRKENIQKTKDKIVKIVESIRTYRMNAKAQIIENMDQIISDDVTHIFLLGFSSTIISLLENYIKQHSDKKGRSNIYVLECSTKRRLGHSNLIEYNDGIHYSTEIGKLDFFNVHLIPDLGFATFLDIQKQNIEITDKDYFKQHYLILFGANGIDKKTGDCGHTSGHLSVAIVAKQFDIPVKVLSDSFKLGSIKWNPDAKRKGDWLVTQKKYVEELRLSRVCVENLREDRISKDFISEIITEKIKLNPNENDYESKLEELIKQADEFFQEMLCLAEKQE